MENFCQKIPFTTLKYLLHEFEAGCLCLNTIQPRHIYGYDSLLEYFNRHQEEMAIITMCRDNIYIEHEFIPGIAEYKKLILPITNPFIKFLLNVLKKENDMTTNNTTTTKSFTVSSNTSDTSNLYYVGDCTNTTTTASVTISPDYYYNGDIFYDTTAHKMFINGKEVVTKSKEKENNMNKMFNFDFGHVDNSNIAICPFGIAIKNTNGQFCYYNAEKHEIVDCTPFSFDSKKFLYKMPVAISAIEIGDVIIHNEIPMFVKGYEDEEGRILTIDIKNGEEKYILPTKNMFGFNYITKIVSLLDTKHISATEDNPFGNMLLPLMLMQDGNDMDFTTLLLLNATGSGSTNAFGPTTLGNLFNNNQTLMWMLMKDNKNMKDILPFLMATSIMPQ